MKLILKDINIEAKPGETIALVGPTGAGKTTILALIVRNYEIQKGQILIDGIDIKKIKISSLRSQIGQMLQDVFLFSGTIADNIRLNDETITDDDILKEEEEKRLAEEEAARIAEEEAANAPKPVTTEDLLTEIRDLLKEKK